MKFPLGWLLFNKWLWIIIGCMSAILIGPFFMLYFILILPAEFRGIAIVMVVLGWGIVGGYKDWVIAKHQEEKMKIPTTETYHE